MPTCQKCNTAFPTWIVVDGKKRNAKNRKYCLECSPFGLHNTRILADSVGDVMVDDIIVPIDKHCNKCYTTKPISEFYMFRDKKGYYGTCKSCLQYADRVNNYTFKLLCIEYKGGKCESCGYDKNISAMHFHHNDPSQKDFGVSSKSRTSKLNDVIKSELDKCKLLCANCHAETHHPESLISKNDTNIIDSHREVK